jgi:hypothetical protein
MDPDTRHSCQREQGGGRGARREREMQGRTQGRMHAKPLSGRRCGKSNGASDALMLHQHVPTHAPNTCACRSIKPRGWGMGETRLPVLEGVRRICPGENTRAHQRDRSHTRAKAPEMCACAWLCHTTRAA